MKTFKLFFKADLLGESVFFVGTNDFFKVRIARLPTIKILWLEQNNIIVFIINFLQIMNQPFDVSTSASP